MANDTKIKAKNKKPCAVHFSSWNSSLCKDVDALLTNDCTAAIKMAYRRAFSRPLKLKKPGIDMTEALDVGKVNALS